MIEVVRCPRCQGAKKLLGISFRGGFAFEMNCDQCVRRIEPIAAKGLQRIWNWVNPEVLVVFQ